MYMDTHAHIYKEYYNDIEKLLIQIKKDNCFGVINAGCNQETNEEVILLAKKYNNLFATLGIHPENATNYKTKNIDYIIKHLKEERVVGIGEIGLDFHYQGYNKEEQIMLFEKQLAIAQKHKLPVVIHSRDATNDTIKCLKKFKVTGVIHCFTGSIETAREYIKLGYKLGIGGVVTFKNAKLKEVVNAIGLENIVLETDCPYLSPDPVRGKINHPGNIKYIIEFLSKYLNISEKEIIKKTNENVKKVFDINIMP